MMQRFLSFARYSGLFCVILLIATSFASAQIPADAGQPSSPSPNTQQLTEMQKVVDRWDDAVNQRDQYALELVLAPQFIAISDTGAVTDRDQQVSQMLMKGAPRFTLTQKAVSVRMLGDVAVVNGTYDRVYQGSRLSHTKMQDQKGVFSQVYVRARNSWECINSQRTIIVEDTAKEKKKKSQNDSNEKPLTHGLGFSLPGLHHSDSQPHE